MENKKFNPAEWSRGYNAADFYQGYQNRVNGEWLRESEYIEKVIDNMHNQPLQWISPEPVQTLRDTIAIAAMQGTIAGLWASVAGSGIGHGWKDHEIAEKAYGIADAMLQERDKQQL